MNILHTIPGRNWGGMEQRALEQVRWLLAHGHSAWYAAPPDGEPFEWASAAGVPVVPMTFDPAWRLDTMGQLRRFVRDNAIDIIDTHVTRDAKAAMACLDLCAVVRSRHVDQTLASSWTRRLQWRRGADHIITVAGTIRQHLIDIGLADADRATWVGGWAEERFFAAADAALAGARARVRGELDLPDGVPVLLCVGMLRPDKGQDHLIHALALLAERGLAPICLLAGAPTAETQDYADGLKVLAEKLGVLSQLRFLGYRQDVQELMQATDLVVIASLIEGQPRVAVQSFASRRPLVATSVGGVPEIVRDGDTGWLVAPADRPALAAAIARVIETPAEAAKVAANARSVAETTMRIDIRMEQTLDTYRRAMAYARTRRLPPWRGKK